MKRLTMKSINAAIAKKGFDIFLVHDSSQYYPFHFEGQGMEFMHSTTVTRRPIVKKVNDLSLDDWLLQAEWFFNQFEEQRERIKLPEWIKVGSSVFTVQNGFTRETKITRIYGDGSTRVTVEYENGNHSWLWSDGTYCTGPHLFKDRDAYNEMLEAQARAAKVLSLFSSLSVDEQIAFINKIAQ